VELAVIDRDTGSSRTSCRVSSNRFTRPSPTAWAWGFRLPTRLSRRIMGASGRRTIRGGAVFRIALPVAEKGQGSGLGIQFWRKK
jgi:hypothetical protein